ncbi:MAG: hypothetical protein NPINA01_01420 [Nitrospinaceae bacterium]|nr:MAG: hypothetical protein NPINA01_01420 [Nitrospinaceae bacterium]
MEFHEKINTFLEEIKEENQIFSKAENPEEQIESLKEILDCFMRGAHSVQERIDNYNDRRWQR